MKPFFSLILPAMLLAFVSCSGSSDKFVGRWRVVGGVIDGLSEPVIIEKRGTLYNLLRPFGDGNDDLRGFTYDKQRDVLLGTEGRIPCELRFDKATGQLDWYRPSRDQHLFLMERADKPDRIAAMIFGNVKTSISDSDKARIISQLHIRIAPGGEAFVGAGDRKFEYPFLLKVYPVDLNNDGKEEIYILYDDKSQSATNYNTDGTTTHVDYGYSSVLFNRSITGRFEGFENLPGTLLYLSTRTNGYYDLAMTRKTDGDRLAVFKFVHNHWNYVTMEQDAIKALNPKPLEQLSPAYQGAK